MRIFAHRGYWNDSISANSILALKAALENGYDFESDVRDYDGRLVISHNIADRNSPNAEEFFAYLSEYENQYCFAINIKADGLKGILRDYLEKYDLRNYFLFDMSVPQMFEFVEMGLRFFTRMSEYEQVPVMLCQAAGIWVDSFEETDWIMEEQMCKYISAGKEICLVSPELHGKRDYRKLWGMLRGWDIDFSKVFLCTDHPDEARTFFADKLL